jgi:hypothetical protein
MLYVVCYVLYVTCYNTYLHWSLVTDRLEGDRICVMYCCRPVQRQPAPTVSALHVVLIYASQVCYIGHICYICYIGYMCYVYWLYVLCLCMMARK